MACAAVQITARAAQAGICIKHTFKPAAQQLCCVELHSSGRCLIGRVVVVAERSAHAVLSALPSGPASMDPDMALLTVRLAGVSRVWPNACFPYICFPGHARQAPKVNLEERWQAL